MCRRARYSAASAQRSFVLLVVVIDHAAIGQRQVGEEMMRADDAPHRKIRDRRVDMRDQMQPARPDP